MKIVNIQGGLGNQMLQYAFAYKLKKLNPSENIYLDLTNFKGYEWHSYELKYVFDVSIPEASFFQLCKLSFPFSGNTKFGRFLRQHIPRRHIYYEKKSFEYDEEALKKKGDCYYNGYWFNEKYFSDIRTEILDIFTFKRPLSQINQNLKAGIEESNSVSIHVRRGNYLLFDEYKGICEEYYYEKAIQYIKSKIKNPHFYIFSNDPQWCKENIIQFVGNNFTFADNNDALSNYVDLQLMSLCKHNIIAHSSFSWWAAWLNSNPEKIVVSPHKWVNRPNIQFQPQLDSWVLI